MTFSFTRGAFLVTTATAAMGLRTGAAAADEPGVLRIACSSVEAQAQGYYAAETGLFRKSGIAVEFEPMRGGSATVSAVVGGAVQIGCTNPVSLGQALQRKIPLVILTTGAVWDSRTPNGFAIVAPNSPVRSAKELAGQTIGIPSLGGLNQLIMTAFIQADGGDVATVKFVELPESSTAEALATGRIAASYMDEPQFSAAGNRIRSIGPASDAVAKSFAETVWFTTNEWLSRNKPLARRIVDALRGGGRWAMANPVPAANVLEKRLGFKESRAQMRFATVSDPTLVQVLFDCAAKFHVFAPMRAADYVWNGT